MVRNMTEGSPLPQIIRFSLPLMAGNLLQETYNVADGAIVGSAIVKLMAEHGREAAPYVADYVRRMKDGVRQAD